MYGVCVTCVVVWSPSLRAFCLGIFALPPNPCKNCHSGSVVACLLLLMTSHPIDQHRNKACHRFAICLLGNQVADSQVQDILWEQVRHLLSAKIDRSSRSSGTQNTIWKTALDRFWSPKICTCTPRINRSCCIYHQFIVYWNHAVAVCHCGARKRVQLLWIPRSSTRHFTWLPRISALTLLGAVFHGFSICLLSLVAEFPKDYQDFHVCSSQTGAFASAICDLATAGLGEIHVSSECLLHYYHDVHLSIHFRIHYLCFWVALELWDKLLHCLWARLLHWMQRRRHWQTCESACLLRIGSHFRTNNINMGI